MICYYCMMVGSYFLFACLLPFEVIFIIVVFNFIPPHHSSPLRSSTCTCATIFLKWPSARFLIGASHRIASHDFPHVFICLYLSPFCTKPTQIKPNTPIVAHQAESGWKWCQWKRRLFLVNSLTLCVPILARNGSRLTSDPWVLQWAAASVAAAV